MRLIDADALFSALYDTKWHDNADMENALDLVEDAPAVDAVSVVRCKDCEYADSIGNSSKNRICKLNRGLMWEDDFCSYGEAK